MSTPLMQGKGPKLGSLSTGTEKIDPCTEVKLKNFPQNKPGLQTGDFVSLKKQQPKHFDDGPLPPLSPSQEQHGLLDEIKVPDLDFSKSFQPKVDNYIPGLVKHTSKVVLVDLAENVPRLTSGTTGAIVDEGFEPTCDLYSEGVHFLLEKRLSRGSFGCGDLCVDAKSQKKFFRKTMELENFRSSEVTVPINLNHENVTKLYGLIHRNEKDQNRIVELLIEPAGMALNTYAQKCTIETPRIWDISRQTMAGLNHMHFYGMIHFDIKPENICIIERGGKCCDVKITDFGSAKLPQEPIQFIGWTPEYMCPETCQLFLLKRGLMNGEIKESDITGKVDVFAAALVIMYLYVKGHLLQKLITNGKTSYKDYDNQARISLQLNLMKMLAQDRDILRYVIPDECDIDMRELLGGMTQHDPKQRYSAQDVIDFIDKREKRRSEAINECFRKLRQQQNEKARIRESSSSLPFVDHIVTDVPEIAYNCLEKDNGPIKNSTNAALREKLRPYPGQGKVKKMKVETPVQELRRMEVASKRMEDFPAPQTPVSEMAASLANLNMKKNVNHTERNAVVTQPMADDTTQIYKPQVMVQNLLRPMNNKVLPPQTHLPATTAPFGVQQNTPNTSPKMKAMMESMQQMLNKGQVKIHMTETGPKLVQVPLTQSNVAQNRSGVRPYIPASPANMTHGEMEFPDVSSSDEMEGNVPDFMKLG